MTNSQDVEKQGAKPKFQEIGPFTYKVYMHKYFIASNSGIVSSKEKRTFVFEPSLSSSPEETIVTTVNAPLVIVLNALKSAPLPIRIMVEGIIKRVDHGFIIEKTVKELLFNGYDDILMKALALVDPEARKYKGRFGYLLNQNASYDKLFSVFDGTDNVNRLNYIFKINNTDHLNTWFGEDCNSFAGVTRGEIFPPMRTTPFNNIYFFVSDFCRKFSLKYQRSNTLANGLKIFEYVFDPLNVASPSDFPVNSCYFNDKKKISFDGMNGTLPSGVIDISPCKAGSPIFLSYPHFLDANDYYLSKVGGIRPNASAHRGFFYIDQATGSSVKVAARFQVNLGVSIKNFVKTHNMPNIIFPIFWSEFHSEISKEIESNLLLADNFLFVWPSLFFLVCSLFSGLLVCLTVLKMTLCSNGFQLKFYGQHKVMKLMSDVI